MAMRLFCSMLLWKNFYPVIKLYKKKKEKNILHSINLIRGDVDYLFIFIENLFVFSKMKNM